MTNTGNAKSNRVTIKNLGYRDSAEEDEQGIKNKINKKANKKINKVVVCVWVGWGREVS